MDFLILTFMENVIMLTILLLLEIEVGKRLFGCRRTDHIQVSYLMRMLFYVFDCVQLFRILGC